jgi:hypothetical protein
LTDWRRSCGGMGDSSNEPLFGGRGTLSTSFQSMITVRFEPVPPFDEEGNPEHWIVVNSRNEETRRFGGRQKLLAQTYVTEFNIAAFEADRRILDARSGRAAAGRSRSF